MIKLLSRAIAMETELERDGGFTMVTVKGVVKCTIDRRYGADADGNRAMEQRFVDVINVKAFDDNTGEAVELTEKEEMKLSKRLADRYLEQGE